MALYEMRTYTVYVGKMAEVLEHYSELGWPAIRNGGFDAKLVGYFTSDVGTLHQIMHIWKFDDDADRRGHWQRLFADEDFMAFAPHIRPLIRTQEVSLWNEAPFGPHP
jgi:hypothetical protein